MKNKIVNPYTAIKLAYSYPILFATTALVMYLANILYPQCVVLGTQSISYGWSFIHIAGTLAMLDVLVVPLVREYENKIGKMITDKDWMVAYFVVNFIGLYLMSKFANNLGMGLKAWYSAALMSLVLTPIQGVAMMLLDKTCCKK